MADKILIYLSFHKPRHLKLPPSPPEGSEGLAAWFLDRGLQCETFLRWLNEVGIPYTDLLLSLVQEGMHFLLSFSGSLLEDLAEFSPLVPAPLWELLHHPHISLACPFLKNSISPYLGLDGLQKEIKSARDLLQQRFSCQPSLAAAPYLAINHEIYHTFKKIAFKGVLADGYPAFPGRSLRTAGYLMGESSGPLLLARHSWLSMLISSTLKHSTFSLSDIDSLMGELMMSPGYLVLLGWLIGASEGDRGLAFMKTFCHEMLERNIKSIGLEELFAQDRPKIKPPALPTLPTFCAEIGDISYFLGHPRQQSIFQLMTQAYNLACLTNNPEAIGLALTLSQWDILGLLHYIYISQADRPTPEFLTEEQWKRLGGEGTVAALYQTYDLFTREVRKL